MSDSDDDSVDSDGDGHEIFFLKNDACIMLSAHIYHPVLMCTEAEISWK